MIRNNLIQDLAEDICESVDLKDLLRYYYEDQVDYMNSLTDAELIDFAISIGKDPIILAEEYGVEGNKFKDDENLEDE